MARQGRPGIKPTEKQLEAVYDGARRGLNNKEIAESIGVPYSTFYHNIELFKEHIEKGRDDGADANIKLVESALLKRCLGFDYIETHEETGSNEKGLFEKTKTVTKKVLPDPTSIFFFLCNRAPDKWKSINKAEVNVGNIVENWDNAADAIAFLDTSSN